MASNPNALFGAGGYGSGTYGSPALESLPAQYYLNLITSQYQSAPNHIAWMTVVIDMFMDVFNCLEMMPIAFDIDYAMGAQLDILGQIIGQSRTVAFQPSAGVSPVLDDNTYRLLLKARQAQNTWNGQANSLQPIWANLFPGGQIIIEDGQNMTATIILNGSFTSIQQDLINNGYIVPRPETVQYTYAFATLPVFGFGANNSTVGGFAEGKWA